MKDKEFCLLDEGWIKVLDEELRIKEVSLCELFANAHRYKCLAGESVTQDAAVFRVLLAIAITVFYRIDADGNIDDVLERDVPEETILERWGDYYHKGKFHEKAFQEYLEKYRERFYLFHPEYPFWQVPDLEYGTPYDMKCFIGNMKESNNKKTKHHFSVTDGDYLEELDYAEVTRWLIYLNAYAVNIKADAKAPGTKEATGTGRLGRLGLVLINGKNIFEQLLFNLCALRNNDVWGAPKPIWEYPKLDMRQGVKIEPPDNLPRLYTMQSRRIMLKRKDRKIIGFKAIGGEFYDIVNDTVEQMTLLCERKPQKKGDKGDIAPKTHNKEINAWREFPSLFVEGDLKPGIVIWMDILYDYGLIDRKRMLTFQMTGLEYGDGMSYTYGDIINDSLSLSVGFLSELGKPWITRVKNQVEKCENIVSRLFYFFAKDIAIMLYHGDNDKAVSIRKPLATRYYFLINNPFKDWLAGINPETDDKDEKEYEWERQSYSFAKQTVDEYIHRLDEVKLLQVMQSYDNFMTGLSGIYKRREIT